MEALELFLQFKEQSIQGRYLTLEAILPILEKHNADNQLKHVGNSVQQKPIYTYQIGSGKTKIFLWSQMHGNESTTTKALLDFINFLNSDIELATMLLEDFTFLAIPILNPDGAALYTRENANKVDLNRDSQDLTQPESTTLRGVFEVFQPDYCFNLHDQRTIFGVAATGKPATVSFLAPSYNEAREINVTRLKAIRVIENINTILQNYIPGQVGRFDDSFNINCIGDTFQYLGVPTILFEAGHFPDDYQREETRKFIFISLLASFTTLSENDVVDNEINQYLNIPQNKVVFYDFICKNIKINYDGNEIMTNFAVQYKEELIDGKVNFIGYIAAIDNLESYFGHYVYDAKGALYSDDLDNFPKINQIADFSLDGTVVFVNGMIKV
ncbi:M14 metallopeptidase family protein [Flavobacterium sp.]|uniref:M14 family metallopeptidase n=1 Tax=Flavobacterium sp. TaxID=239 RepID=UPI0022CCF315|nr:M14 metallopeptidase family protein [Flavobacterium sp.]MCZ8228558.1 M14 family metallopeptidase [Flavobacterium sp.]